MLIDHVSDLGRELLMHVRFRVYAVLFYSRLFVHWQRNSSPRWLRWVFTLGRNLTGSRRSKEYSELLEAQKAVYPFSINLTIIVFGLFLKLTDFPLALILYETGYFGSALLLIFVVGDPFRGLILSQMVLSIQLPITIFTQVYLTSSKKVMGEFANSRLTNIILLILGTIVSLLNLFLLVQLVIG